MDFSNCIINEYIKENNGNHVYRITVNGIQGILSMRTKLSTETLQESLINAEILTTNDKYFTFRIEEGLMQIIFPASKDDFRKYLAPRIFGVETYQDFLKNYRPEPIPWIQNIFNGNEETEKIIFQDEELFICIDSKWDGRNKEDLYLLALFTNRVSCIRDVEKEMLIGAKNKILKTMKKVYGMNYGDFLMFIHYPPSFYCLHIHIVALSRTISETSMVGRAILLDDAIKNLDLDINYYKREIYCILPQKYP